MALYSFDGTWNKDKTGTERDTNVLLFGAACQKTVWYKKEVGTRFGILGKIVGGITGAGGRSRVRDGLKELRKNLKKGDDVIDIIGFSRGAALALHFANQIAAKKIQTRSGKQAWFGFSACGITFRRLA